MKILAYLCLYVVILIQSLDGLPISCIGGTGCEPTEIGMTATATTATATVVTPTARTTTSRWSHRRVICPPFFPNLDETLLEADRMLSSEKARQSYNAVTEFFKRLLKSPKSNKAEESTNTRPTQGVRTTEFKPTTGRRTTISFTVQTLSTDAEKQPSTTEIPHIFAWRSK